MTEDEMSLAEILEMVRRVDEARTNGEVDIIGSELTPERRLQVCNFIAQDGQQVEQRAFGERPPIDAISENRWYFHSKFCR
jgi:hypothetical protein